MTFPCVGCGACCMSVGHLPELESNEDGVCINLTSDNQCAIYETRPTICRIMDVRPPLVSEETWVAMGLFTCNLLHAAHYGGQLEEPGQVCQHRRKV